MLALACVLMAVPAHAAAPSPPEAPADGVIIRWNDAPPEARTSVAHRHRLGATRSRPAENTEVVEVAAGESPAAVAARLSADPHIAHAEPNYRLDTFQDPAFGEQWGLDNSGQTILDVSGTSDVDINAPEAWTTTRGDSDVIVAVIDTGTDIDHPDLQANVWVNRSEADRLDGVDDDDNGYVDDVNGWDFSNDDATVFDAASEDFHGTHVAGTVAAPENGRGVVGVAPGVRIMPLKALGADGGTTAEAVAAITYAAANGASIVNASWGSSGRSQLLYETIRDSGLLVVAAAGNAKDGDDARDLDTDPIYPAAFDLPNVVSVAAVDNTGALAPWSNYGDAVDLGAPGVGVVSTYPGNRYAYLEGTSMAAPHVSGAAALAASHDRGATAVDLADVLTATVRPLSSLARTTATGGMLDAAAVLAGSTEDVTKGEDDPLPDDGEEDARGEQAADTACPDEIVPESTFTDVAHDSVHRTAIACIAWWGIATGTGHDTFAPAADTTRGQMATFLARLLDTVGIEPQNSDRDHFADDDGSVHETAIDMLAELEIVTGSADGRYRPDAAVTRAQMATFLVRTYETLTDTTLPAGDDAFTDDDGSVHETAIDAAHAAGWATGRTESGFDPDGRLRRDQMGSFLRRLMDTLVAEGHLAPPQA